MGAPATPATVTAAGPHPVVPPLLSPAFVALALALLLGLQPITTDLM